MSVTASVQQMASGLASILGGLILGAPGGAGEGLLAEGRLTPIVGYGWVGLISAVFTVMSVILAGKLRPAEGGLAEVDALPDAMRTDKESAALPNDLSCADDLRFAPRTSRQAAR